MNQRYITNYFLDLKRSREEHLSQAEGFELRIQECQREIQMLRSVYERAASLRALLIGLMLGFLTSDIVVAILDQVFGPSERLVWTFWACLVMVGVFAVILVLWQQHMVKMLRWLDDTQIEMHRLANRRDDAKYGAAGDENELAEMRQAFPWLVEA